MSDITRRSFIVAGGVGLVVASEAIAQTKDPKPVENCPFCKIVAGKLSAFKLWEDKHSLVFLDHKPISPGHTLVIPKLHYPYLFDMPEKGYSQLLSLSRRLSFPIQRAMGSKRIGVLVEGFGVDHSHIHLVPINGSNELTKKGVAGVADDEFRRVSALITAEIAKTRNLS